MLKDLLDYKKDNYLTKQKQTLKTKKLLIFGGILDTFNIASFIVDLFNSRNIDFSYIAHKKFIMQRVDEGAIQINGNHYKYNNRNVYPLEEHNLNTDEYTAFIGISLLDFAREELTKYGFSDVQVLDPFSYFHEISYDYFANNFEEFESFYNSLEDSLSKQIMENYFQSRIYGDYKGLMNTANPGYFNKLLTYGNNEVLIDCGAYDGDTALEFIEACPNYAGVYSYEMDIKNLAKLRENAKGKKIVVIPKGVYSKKDTLTFNITHDMCSHITEDKTNNKNKILELEVDSIDNLFYHGNDSIYSKEVATPPPTIIKMDIEGAELEALKGAENTIKKYKPKLALSIYHRREDMLSIPKYLQSLNCGYRFYLRNFWWFSVDIVLYAIPTHKHKDIR